MKRLKTPLCGNTTVILLLWFAVICAAPDITHAYILNRWVFDSAGGYTFSTGYINLSAVAQSTPPGVSVSTGYRNYAGFLHSVAAEGNLLPDYTVSLAFAGTGSGTVTSFPAGIQCNVNCSAPFNAYFPVTLTPTADQYMIFSGWNGGGCSGSDPCTITLTGNISVTATFDRDAEHAVYIPGATPGTGTYYATLQAAYDGAESGAAVSAWATTYLESLICGQAKSVILKGGYDQSYTSQTGYTTLDGVLNIRQGRVTAERLKVK